MNKKPEIFKIVERLENPNYDCNYDNLRFLIKKNEIK